MNYKYDIIKQKLQSKGGVSYNPNSYYMQEGGVNCMELKILKEIAIIFVIFTYAISLLADSYSKIKSAQSKNHPKAKKGGRKR